MTEKRKLSSYKIIIYCAVFYALWSVRELVIRPQFLDSLNDVSFQIAETLMKLLVWTLPAVLLIKRYHDDMWIGLKEILTTKPKWFWYILIMVAFFFFNAIRAWIAFGTLAVHPDFKPITLVEAVIFVGVTEEIVFRGWLLNAMLKRMKYRFALLLNAVLFALIHYPIWIYHGYGALTILSGSLSVVVLSAVFSWTFTKSKSIFIPIVIHMSWNLFLTLFFG